RFGVPARGHLERQYAANVVVVREHVDHAQPAADIREPNVPAIRSALLDEPERLGSVDRRDGDRTGTGVDKPRRIPVRPNLEDAVARDELEVLAAAAARDLLVVRALVQDAHAGRRVEVGERTREVAVVATDVAPLRRRRGEEHAVIRTLRVDELEGRARVVVRDDLLAGEREPGHPGGPAVRAVLAHADAVAEARAVEGHAGHDREELLLALDAELAEPGDALLHHVPLDAVVAGSARKRHGDRYGHRGKRRHARWKLSARAIPDDG